MENQQQQSQPLNKCPNQQHHAQSKQQQCPTCNQDLQNNSIHTCCSEEKEKGWNLTDMDKYLYSVGIYQKGLHPNHTINRKNLERYEKQKQLFEMQRSLHNPNQCSQQHIWVDMDTNKLTVLQQENETLKHKLKQYEATLRDYIKVFLNKEVDPIQGGNHLVSSHRSYRKGYNVLYHEFMRRIDQDIRLRKETINSLQDKIKDLEDVKKYWALQDSSMRRRQQYDGKE